jgi:hypothetical protein
MLGAVGDLRGVATLGKFRIVLPLGQGGTADVYLAVADGPAGFQKLVVLKVLKQSLAGDPEFRAMFSSEARLAARLHHPNVVQTNEVLDLGGPGGTPAMVMEYLDGQPLAQVIVRGRENGFSLAMQVRVLVDALAGLHAAHELDDVDGTPLAVVHRDVSPQNLFVTVEGHAKVLDFGIAKLARSGVETEVGTIKGKLRYMAPEQIAGAPLDRPADIYATGVILWEALAGDRMWRGCSEQQIKARVQAGDLPVPDAARGGAPASLERICRRALALAPRDRYATALELADELEAALPGLGRPVSHREIGATVMRLFADERAQTRAAIEQKVGALSAATFEAGTPSTHPGTHESAPHPAEPLAAPASRGHRRALLVIPAAAGLLALGGLGTWRAGLLRGERPSTAAPLVIPAAALVAPAPAAPAAADTARPAEGARQATPPDERTVRPRGPAAARSQQKRTPRPAPAGAPAGAAPAGPPLDCSHPFFVDVDGIKKVRAECR